MALLILLLSLYGCGFTWPATPFQGTQIGVSINERFRLPGFRCADRPLFLKPQKHMTWHLIPELRVGDNTDLAWMFSDSQKSLGHNLIEAFFWDNCYPHRFYVHSVTGFANPPHSYVTTYSRSASIMY